jgi:hypothetical protein
MLSAGYGPSRVSDMADERAHLAQADRHIADAKEHIRKQQELIERLVAKGRSVTFCQRHRLLILDRLRP